MPLEPASEEQVRLGLKKLQEVIESKLASAGAILSPRSFAVSPKTGSLSRAAKITLSVTPMNAPRTSIAFTRQEIADSSASVEAGEVREKILQFVAQYEAFRASPVRTGRLPQKPAAKE